MDFKNKTTFVTWAENHLKDKVQDDNFVWIQSPAISEIEAGKFLRQWYPNIRIPSPYTDGGWRGLSNFLGKIWDHNYSIICKTTLNSNISLQNGTDNDKVETTWKNYDDTIHMKEKINTKMNENISIQTGDDDDNVFTLLERKVKDIYDQYVNLRKRIDWKDSGNYRTITRLARPFINGYFTIAVAGKMSAGKSTFINTLLGEELLPTGHFQTTSTITWIISSDKREMQVTYANGKTKVFTEKLAEELRGIAAIPEKYEELPVNRINVEIQKGSSPAAILSKKKKIEEETDTSASESLWREYISETSLADIAVKIEIYLPLPKQYRGWRIVDTPGVGAIGGIQEATKDLLTSRDQESDNHEVDAVILLHKGSENIQDEAANQFAKGVKEGLGSLADGRLFFVLTHAMSPEFKKEKNRTLKKAEMLFGQKLGIAYDRILYVDSLVERFIKDARREKIDFSATDGELPRTPWQGWNKEAWKEMRHLLTDISDYLEENKLEISNSTIFSQLENEARFGILKQKLDKFLLDNKAKTYEDLFERIERELNAFAYKLRSDIETVSSGKACIQNKIEENTREASRLQKILGQIREKATPMVVKEKFSFITDELLNLKNKKNLPAIKTAYQEIIERGKSTEREFFTSLIAEFRAYCSGFQNISIIFQSIDFESLEKDATRMATEEVVDYSRPETIKHCCSADEIYYPHKKDQVNQEKQIREFLARVVNKGKTVAEKYVKGVEQKLNDFYNIVYKEIGDKEEARKKELNGYDSDISNKDSTIARLNSQLNEVNKTLDELNKLK